MLSLELDRPNPDLAVVGLDLDTLARQAHAYAALVEIATVIGGRTLPLRERLWYVRCRKFSVELDECQRCRSPWPGR